MKNKILFWLFLLLTTLNLYSNSELVQEYNARAEESIINDPFMAIYYGFKAIDENRDIVKPILKGVNTEDSEEEQINYNNYINSLLILSKAYGNIEEFDKQFNYIEMAFPGVNNNEDLIYIAESLYNLGKLDDLKSMLTNGDIVNNLDERALVVFNLLKIKLNASNVSKTEFDLLDRTVNICINKNYTDLLAKVYSLYGDLLFTVNTERSMEYYYKASELNGYYSAYSLLKLGLYYKSVNYLTEAYLFSEGLSDYKLSKDIIAALIERYDSLKDYKSKSQYLDRLLYLEKNYSNFLLIQRIKNERYSFEREKFLFDKEELKNKNRLYFTVIVASGIVILMLIVLLSVQTFRLRHYKLH